MQNQKKSDLIVSVVRYVSSIIFTFAVGAILITLLGESPVKALTAIVKGAVGSLTGIGTTIHWLIPCILSALAALVAFKSGVMNLGVEGQIYFGGLAAGCVGYMVELPPIIHPLACIIAGGLAAMLWALIPALLRLIFNIDEVVTTLILNYVAIQATELITLRLMAAAKSLSATSIMTSEIHDTARLSVLIKGTSATSGLYIALAAVLAMFFFYKYTRSGYELKQVGENLKFAKYGGANAGMSFIAIFLVSGFIAGVCGAVETIGINYKFISRFSTNLGWDGVMITRVAGNSPFGVLGVSAVWAALKTGSMAMERTTELSRYVVNTLQALFVLFISINYRYVIGKIQDAFKKARLARESKQERGMNNGSN